MLLVQQPVSVGGCGRDNLVRGSLSAYEHMVIPWRAFQEAVVTRGKVSVVSLGSWLKGRANPIRKDALSWSAHSMKGGGTAQRTREEMLGGGRYSDGGRARCSSLAKLVELDSSKCLLRPHAYAGLNANHLSLGLAW